MATQNGFHGEIAKWKNGRAVCGVVMCSLLTCAPESGQCPDDCEGLPCEWQLDRRDDGTYFCFYCRKVNEIPEWMRPQLTGDQAAPQQTANTPTGGSNGVHTSGTNGFPAGSQDAS